MNILQVGLIGGKWYTAQHNAAPDNTMMIKEVLERWMSEVVGLFYFVFN